MVTRLVYDSVSLLSHLLRANVGAVHLWRQPGGGGGGGDGFGGGNTSAGEAWPWNVRAQRRRRAGGGIRAPRARHPGSQRERGLFLTFPNRRSRSAHGRSGRSSIEPRDQEAERERERLYFEVKTLTKAQEGAEFERQLESIIGSRRIAAPANGAAWGHEGGRDNKSRPVEMRIMRPTTFPGLRGRGAINPNGQRTFDFLLLDWRPMTEQLAVVLALTAAPPGLDKVRHTHTHTPSPHHRSPSKPYKSSHG